MATFWAIATNEARQLWRRRSFWVIQGLLLLLLPALLIVFGPPIPTALVLLYLVIPFLTGPALLRDLGKPGEVLWSSPTDALTHYAGVIAGLWLGLLAGALLQLAGWFLADLFVPNSFSFWIWPASLAFLLLANTIGLFLTAFLAMLVRRTVPLLVIWTALWLWIFWDVIFAETMAEGFNPMQLMIWNNIFFHNLAFSPSLGLGLSGDRVLGMAAWFLGLGFLAVILGLLVSLLADRRRSIRHSMILPALVLVGALAALGGYALNSRAAVATALPTSPYDPQIDAWEVEGQQAEVEVNASTGEISGKSRLALDLLQPIAKPELVIRLNPGLELAYARDASGADLSTRRVGDSVLVGLPAIPTGTIQLDLAWQGRLEIPYLSFEQSWMFPDGPDLVPYWYMPLPLKALVIPQGGFLLRDGDWMPWPWTSKPHQAGQNSLTIRPTGAEAAAARPIQDGAVTWEGPLPKGLVAFLPTKRIPLDQASSSATTLAVSPLAGSQHSARSRLFTEAASRIAALFGEQPPRYIVVSPYLSELVWSDDLLLIPDGGGFYKSLQLWWVFQQDADGPKRLLLERTALYLLARSWMHGRFDSPPLPFQTLLSPQEEGMRAVSLSEISEDRWYQETGHWMQFAEVMDMTTTWSPRRNFHLEIPGEQSALAFWLAMELADEETRQADLDLLAYFASVGQQLQGYGERYRMINDLGWPDLMYTREARELVWDLHEWAVRVGPEEAVATAVEVIQETEDWDLDQVLAEFEARSGVSIGEGR